jgi:hypothetical protein
MDAASVFLGRELMKRMEEQKGKQTEMVLIGACRDYADYKGKVGYLKGLTDCLKWIEEISLGGSSHARDDATRS